MIHPDDPRRTHPQYPPTDGPDEGTGPPGCPGHGSEPGDDLGRDDLGRGFGSGGFSSAGLGSAGLGSDDLGRADLDSDTLSSDEQALRRLLHDAVRDIEPAGDALSHLRRAVPARRTHRHQAWAGLAAACLLAGTAIPAVVHAANTPDQQQSDAASASHSATTDGAADGGARNDASEDPDAAAGSVSGDVSGKGEKPSGTKAPENSPTKPASTAGTSSPTGDTSTATPYCTTTQLGQPTATSDAADSSGTVYGSFQVANVSASTCQVGPGAIAVTGQGSADLSRINVVDHTAGDAATGLPDPSATSSMIVLDPGTAYLVRFAWIPQSGGGTTGCTPATETPTDNSTDTTAPGDTTEGSTGDGATATPTTDPASIVLTHNPATGGAAGSTMLADACAGTVYRTAPLPAP